MFSLGLVLHEMLTGDLPFEGDSPTELLRERCRRTLSVRDFPASITLPVRALLARMLGRQASTRYATMAKVAHDAAKLQGSGRTPLDLPVDPDAAALVTSETETAIVVREPSQESPKGLNRPVGLLVSGVLAGLVAGLLAGQAFLTSPVQPVEPPLLTTHATDDPAPPALQPLAVAFRFDPGNAAAEPLSAADRIKTHVVRGLQDFPLPVTLDGETEDRPVQVEGKVFASADRVWLGALLKDREGRILHSSVVTGSRADLDALLAEMASKLLEALTEILFNAYGGDGDFSARVSL